MNALEGTLKRCLTSAVILLLLVSPLLAFDNLITRPAELDNALLDVDSLVKEGYVVDGKVKVILELWNGSFVPEELPVTDLNSARPGVKRVFLNHRVSACLNESVPLVKEGWSEVEARFGYRINGSGIKIAILDTGIDKTHPDLDDLDDDPLTNDPKVIAERDFTGSGHTYDDHGHGTHCASIAAGTGAASNYTYVGVAPGAYLLNGKVLDSRGNGWEDWVISGIQWAVQSGANVISMSLTGPGDEDGALALAVDWAVSQGVVVVAAAGNSGPQFYSIGSPGCARGAITVGATTKSDGTWLYSSRGPTAKLNAKPDVCAPGVDIVAARARGTNIGRPLDDYYTVLSGTSMATPHVAGIAALLLQAHPEWGPAQVKAALVETGKDITGNPLIEGGGRVRAAAACSLSDFAYPPSLSFGNVKGKASLNLTVTSVPSSVTVAVYKEGIRVSTAVSGNTVTVTAESDIEGYYFGFILIGTEIRVPFTAFVYVSYPSGGWHIVGVTAGLTGAYHLLVGGDVLYVGCLSQPGAVYALRLPDLTPIASITLPEGGANSLVLLNGYLYVGTASVRARIYKLNATDLSVVAAADTAHCNALKMTAFNGYLYVSYSESPGVMEKIDPDTLKVVRTLWLSSDSESPYGLAAAGGYLYAAVLLVRVNGGFMGRVLKLDPSTLSVIATLDLADYYLEDAVVVGDYLYVNTRGFPLDPAKVIKIDLKAFRVEAVTTLGLNDTFVYDMEYANGNLYLPSEPGHGIRVPLSTFEKDLELQFSDAYPVGVAAWNGYVIFAEHKHGTVYLTREGAKNYSLTILPSVGGRTDPEAGTYLFPEGSNVTVTAIPDVGYAFDRWILDGRDFGGSATVTVTMDADHTLQPAFVELRYVLVIYPAEGGTTDPPPNPPGGYYLIPARANVTVTAIPYPGYRFDHWILDGAWAGNNSVITFVMDWRHELAPVFAKIPAVFKLALIVRSGAKLISGADVFVDGNYVGSTSSGFLVVSVEGGTHTLKVSKAGYFDYVRTVNVVRNAYIFVNLRPKLVTVRITLVDETTGAPVPFARIYIDGAFKGYTNKAGWIMLTLQEGEHTIKVVGTGYGIYEGKFVLTYDPAAPVQELILRLKQG